MTMDPQVMYIQNGGKLVLSQDLMGIGEIDPRNLFTFAVERSFNYVFQKGILRACFTQPPKARVRAVVFRETTIETAEKVQELKALLDDFNYRGVEVDDELVRLYLRSEYSVLKASAEAELLDLQSKPAGVAVSNAIESFLPPLDYFRTDDLQPTREFPYNFGVINTHSAKGTIHFFCLANDICRLKPCVLKLTKKDWSKNESIIKDHLKEKHWQQLIQTGYAT